MRSPDTLMESSLLESNLERTFQVARSEYNLKNQRVAWVI